jgi:hypothetical protein
MSVTTTRACPTCDEQAPREAPACPSCGHTMFDPRAVRDFVRLVLVVLVICGTMMALSLLLYPKG